MAYTQRLDFSYRPRQLSQDNAYSVANALYNRMDGQQQDQDGYLQQQFQNRRFNPYAQEQINVPRGEINPYGGRENPLLEMLRQRESGGDPRAVNSLGYLGQFQMGAPLLSDLGLIKPEYAKMGNKALDMEEAWNIPGGKEAFLSNPQLQDEVMQRAMALNRQRLEQAGLINENTDPRVINGLLASAHLSGVGGTKRLMRGHQSRDAYGTSNRDYYNMGMRSYF